MSDFSLFMASLRGPDLADLRSAMKAYDRSHSKLDGESARLLQIGLLALFADIKAANPQDIPCRLKRRISL